MSMSNLEQRPMQQRYNCHCVEEHMNLLYSLAAQSSTELCLPSFGQTGSATAIRSLEGSPRRTPQEDLGICSALMLNAFSSCTTKSQGIMTVDNMTTEVHSFTCSSSCICCHLRSSASLRYCESHFKTNFRVSLFCTRFILRALFSSDTADGKHLNVLFAFVYNTGLFSVSLARAQSFCEILPGILFPFCFRCRILFRLILMAARNY